MIDIVDVEIMDYDIDLDEVNKVLAVAGTIKADTYVKKLKA